MTITVFFTPKGGQGCTVTTAAAALTAGRPVHVVGDDLPAVFGIPEPVRYPTTDGERADAVRVTHDVTWYDRYGEDVAFGVDLYVDAGVATVEQLLELNADNYVMVLRGPCYLSLRKACTSSYNDLDYRIVLHQEPGRSLNEHDVEHVLMRPITVIPIDPAIARAVDAGLLAARLPQGLRPLNNAIGAP